MGSYVSLFVLTDFNGSLWVLTGPDVALWISMDPYGYL